MEFDRQAIERRDFPIARRGYDPSAVDAHLRALAGEFDEMQRASAGAGSEVSLASTAGSQVQSIIEAAETAASEIERQASEAARQAREAADRDAERTRDEAVEKARAHVAGIAQVAASLLERVGSMDGEASGLIESLRSGASRLANDLSAVEAGMGELYDAASGRGSHDAHGAGNPPGAARAPAPPLVPAPPAAPAAPVVPAPPAAPAPPVLPAQPAATTPPGASAPPAVPAPNGPILRTPPAPAAAPSVSAPQASVAAGGDLDGARLIALNMALNGESRADTERYLADNFQLPDRLKLIDEVYAAIEG